MQQNTPARSRSATARSSACSPASIGAFIWLILTIPISLAMAPMQQRMPQRVLQNAADLPPELPRPSSKACPAVRRSAWRSLFGFFLMLVVSTLFGTLGGLFGALMFRKVTRRRAAADPRSDSF